METLSYGVGLIHVLTHILENVKKISENCQYYVKKIEAESKKKKKKMVFL